MKDCGLSECLCVCVCVCSVVKYVNFGTNFDLGHISNTQIPKWLFYSQHLTKSVYAFLPFWNAEAGFSYLRHGVSDKWSVATY